MPQPGNSKTNHRTQNRNGDAAATKQSLKARAHKPLPQPPGQETGSSKKDKDGRIADITAAYQASSDFESNNQDAISKTGSTFASSAEVKAIEEKVKDFSTSSQVLMDILDDVRKVHPVIDVVVLAFKAVVMLELKRKNNDQKVLVLQVRMQDMMEIFVQLRVIAPAQKEPNRGFTVEESLKKLCTRISEDIWSCANLCDSYSKKKLIVKLLKSPIYEGRLAEYIQTFIERRTELGTVLGMFTAHKIHSTFTLLEANQQVLNSIADSVKVIFEKLRTQTPLEKELWRIIEDRGGVEKCTSDESALKELLKIASCGARDPRETTESPLHVPMNTYATPSATYYPTQRQPRSGASHGDPVYATPTPTPIYYGQGSRNNSTGEHRVFMPPSGPPEARAEARRSHGRSNLYPTQSGYSTPFDPIPGPSVRPSDPFRPASPQNAYTHSASRPFHYSHSRSRPAHQSAPYYVSPVRLPEPVIPGMVPSENFGPVPAPPYEYEDRELHRAPVYELDVQVVEPPQHVINDLKEELQIDVDADLKKNMKVFSRKLDEQRRQLKQIEDTVVRQGNRVVSAIREGPHDRIHDPELREIWKEMGWKLGVPAQEFVHTLHDYYVAQYSDSSFLDSHLNSPAAPGSTAEDQAVALREAFSAAKQRAAERWALKHINVTNIVPLMEVFDGDASGYVSVWEANQVASLRPNNWSFLQWLAYWAAGRHFTIWQYRQKIGAIILHMFRALEDLLPTNRAVVDHYLLNVPNVEQVLGRILPCTEQPEGIFAEKIAAYTRTEESIMAQKLNALNYEIDGPDTLGLIIGESQIERNLLPLIYLLLKHHLTVMQAGTRIVFDREELSTAEESLQQIFDAIRARIETLQWLFRFNSLYGSVEEQLDTFAFGMYSNVFQGYYPDATQLDFNTPESDVVDLGKFNPDVNFKYPSPKIIDPQEASVRPFKLKDYITGVEGFWTGYLFDERHIPIHGMIEFQVQSWNFSDEAFGAIGSYSQGTLSIEGTIRIHKQQGELQAIFQCHPDYRMDQKFDIFLRGTLDIERDSSSKNARSLPAQYTVSGEWGYTSSLSETRGICYFSQTPAWAHHFKSRILETTNTWGRPTRAHSLWKFASDAVLHQVYSEKGLLRTKTVREMLAQLHRGAEISRYQYLLDNQPLNDKDQAEMNKLLLVSAPWNSRFYRSVARTRFNWATLHHYTWCTVCKNIVFGDYFTCYSCSVEGANPGTYDFCSNCRSYHDTPPTLGHSLIKRKRFDHFRDQYPLYELSTRPTSLPSLDSERSMSPIQDDVEIPAAPSALARNNSNASDTKRVRFSLSALRPSSSRYVVHKRHTSYPIGWVTSGPLLSVTSGPHSTDETAVDEFEQATVMMERRCVSCNTVVDLTRDLYWSCVVCSNPKKQEYVVVCSECEPKDRPPIVGLDGGESGHTLEHPILRVRAPPDPYGFNSASWSMEDPDSHISKRKMALKFIKGMFKGLNKDVWGGGSEDGDWRVNY
ncbi:hypothetical protein BT96DRAFT_865607 [Gymnopus androsaceus JB14]|uniref:Uncharacterized protein n=1 Tax=Gymnopus androsaceus JB14 TaxID=1447944 RepID=A0A6A4GZ71_9AGAR|nr:hypothetical protein BT96DRAFT_865607 [Gymnopus androsaceus JB14]